MRVALAQFSGHESKAVNVRKAEDLARQAAGNGARLVCFPEPCTTIKGTDLWSVRAGIPGGSAMIRPGVGRAGCPSIESSSRRPTAPRDSWGCTLGRGRSRPAPPPTS